MDDGTVFRGYNFFIPAGVFQAIYLSDRWALYLSDRWPCWT